jgi:tRNA A-37 threonylcarbamoyl transferase component Bud32
MAFAVDLTGSILDRRYRITGLLGRGGMGHVYDAMHVALDQRVAVKVLHPRYAYEERFRERFLQEARAASRIRHPNVVEIKDFGETPDGSVYFVMEYLRGHDVGAELQRHDKLPWSRTRNILLQAASALHAAHTKKIIHRDIKPGNCFLIEDESEGVVDVVKLLDFGIAKVGSDSHADAQGKGLTGTGEVFGTASYMSPEQARGEVLDARSDMYSLGIMAYEMLVGQVPFTGVNAIHVITQHLTTRPEPLRSHDGTIPPVVEALVLKMMAKERRDRYASMAEVDQALREIPEEVGGRKTRLWSSPGDLRAMVAEKKAVGAAALRSPGQEARGSNVATPDVDPASAAVSGTAVGVDPERTEKVAPNKVAGPGGVKRTLIGADRPSTAAAPARPVVPVSAEIPGSGPAKPVAPVPAAVGAPVLPSAETPASPLSPIVPAAVPIDTPMAAAASFAPAAGGAAPRPNVQAPMGWATPRRDGTNPPPGAEDSSTSPSAWPPSTAGTGPHARYGDTGTETHPHSLQAAQGPALTGRTLLVVGLLVILVGGGSALGTMAFLANREAPEAAQGVVEPLAAKDESVRPEPVTKQEEVMGPRPEAVAQQPKVAELKPEAPAPTAPAEAAIPAKGNGSTPAVVEGEEPAADGGAAPEAPSGKDERQAPRVPPVPKHATEKCAKTYEAANDALDQRKWDRVLELVKQHDCWASQSERRRAQVNALLESGRFAECIKAGSKATDSATVKMVDICRKRVSK